MVILEAVRRKALSGTKNSYSMASLQKHPFGAFIFKTEVTAKISTRCLYVFVIHL